MPGGNLSDPPGVIHVLENLQYLPYLRHNGLVIPVNRNWMIGPKESRSLNVQMKFPPGHLKGVFDCTRSRHIKFSCKTDGVKIWGTLENLTDHPVQINPKNDLCLVYTDLRQMKVADWGITDIKSRDAVMACQEAEDLEVSWEQRFPELFSEGLGLCKTHKVTKLPFKTGVNIKQMKKPPSLSPAEGSSLDSALKDLLQQGVISEASSEPLILPIFPVRKKDGGHRPVLDMRLLNAYVHQEPFIKFNKEHSVAGLRSFKVGSALDLASAFNQVELGESVRRYFGFTLRDKMYVYNRLPFGYCNAPYEFQRALHKSLVKIMPKVQSQVVVYMDDIIVLSDSVDQHTQDLDFMLSILQSDGWKLNLAKCEFFKDQFNYLGLKLDTNGWEPADRAVQKLTDMPCPTTKTQWRRVKGWINSLNRFIFNGAAVMQALQKCEEEKTDSAWKNFLGTLEQHMVRVAHPTSSEGFAVAVDSSTSGWGGCLLQHGRILCCASGLWEKSLHHQKSNALEAEGLVRCLSRFRPYLYGHPVTVWTDNAATFSLAHEGNTSDFVKRRLQTILEFNPEVRFVPGKSNIIPDFLSRQDQLLAVELSVEEVLRRAHEGHFCARKTMDRARALGSDVSWKEVNLWVKNCQACQKFKRKKKIAPLGLYKEALDVGDMVSVDFIGPLSPAEGGSRFIFSVTDHMSRYLWTACCKNSDTATALRLMERYFKECIRPKTLFCDSASYFRSPYFKDQMKQAGVAVVLAASHMHHSNGLNERHNQTLIGRLRRMMEAGPGKPTWRKLLGRATALINETSHDVTGCTPDSLWSGGRSLESVDEETAKLRARAISSTRSAREVWQRKHRTAVDPSQLFPIGTKVWTYNHVRAARLDHKFHSFWQGPYIVEACPSPHLRTIKNLESKKKTLTHIDSLQNFHGEDPTNEEEDED